MAIRNAAGSLVHVMINHSAATRARRSKSPRDASGNGPRLGPLRKDPRAGMRHPVPGPSFATKRSRVQILSPRPRSFY
jgi:hypothetical protein